MNDQELLKSAGLYGRDIATGEEGYNLAAIMLLGKDDVILNVAPTYVTDALVRKVNVDRYDDREIIKTNLIESYDQLLEFGRKNLPDKFFLEGVVNKSLRNTIVREMVSNTLMHREFTSSYTAKFVIEKNRMYVENASRAARNGIITVDNLEPNPKNPIIAAFFRNIGYADQLGSGVRKLFKYCKLYSDKEPEFIEGDVFRINVPLDEDYSFDYSKTNEKNDPNVDPNDPNVDPNDPIIDPNGLISAKNKLLSLIKQNSEWTQKEYALQMQVSVPTVKRLMSKLQKENLVVREGSNRKGKWIIQDHK
ncbi:MAG: ATP-binding protein, partial [Muricoprocola sp.]